MVTVVLCTRDFNFKCPDLSLLFELILNPASFGKCTQYIFIKFIKNNISKIGYTYNKFQEISLMHVSVMLGKNDE